MSLSDNETGLDAIGQKCPIPLLSTKKALSKLKKAQVLKILATDKNPVKDLQAFCEYTDHLCIDDQHINDIFVIRISKG